MAELLDHNRKSPLVIGWLHTRASRLFETSTRKPKRKAAPWGGFRKHVNQPLIR